MKKNIYFVGITLFLLCAWIASIREIYISHKKADRMESNFEAGLSGIRTFYKGEIAVHQVKSQVLTRAEAKRLFSDQLSELEKKIELKKVSQIVNLSGSAGGIVRTQVKDSLILQSDPLQLNHAVGSVQMEKTVLAKVFNYSGDYISLSGVLLNDTANIKYKYSLKCTLTRSLDHREGLWKKITLQPFKRRPVYSFMSEDTSMILDRFSVIEIENR